MKFVETAICGAYLIEPEPIEDERGFFARLWCEDELRRFGLETRLTQVSVSFNRLRGTLRGMHWQAVPHEEVKIVRCTAGSVFDVIVDLRRESPTFMKWTAFELTRSNWKMLYIPEGVAHGFQTLEDETEVFYQMSQHYCPESARGLPWNDPAFGIEWPLPDPILSLKDRNHERFTGTAAAFAA